MLLSRMMRTAAITGRTDVLDTPRVDAFFGGRQGGRWARQTAAAAIPRAAPTETLEELTDLHQRGIITDAEFGRLRTEIGPTP